MLWPNCAFGDVILTCASEDEPSVAKARTRRADLSGDIDLWMMGGREQMSTRTKSGA